MTSGLGSLTLMGRMSRFYYYQMSKAAMNMGMRALRNDLRVAALSWRCWRPAWSIPTCWKHSGYTGRVTHAGRECCGPVQAGRGADAAGQGRAGQRRRQGHSLVTNCRHGSSPLSISRRQMLIGTAGLAGAGLVLSWLRPDPRKAPAARQTPAACSRMPGCRSGLTAPSSFRSTRSRWVRA